MNGSIGWQESPNSVTRPIDQRERGVADSPVPAFSIRGHHAIYRAALARSIATLIAMESRRSCQGRPQREQQFVIVRVNNATKRGPAAPTFHFVTLEPAAIQ